MYTSHILSECFSIICRRIFKHRVIVKAKLGKDVLFDMGKFKVDDFVFHFAFLIIRRYVTLIFRLFLCWQDENEMVISDIWHHAALNSIHQKEQLKAYQSAIDVLQVQ